MKFGQLIESGLQGKGWGDRYGTRQDPCAILPTGTRIDLKEPAKNGWWDDGTYELWTTTTGTACVRTSGDHSESKLGDQVWFKHDQSGKRMFSGEPAKLTGIFHLDGKTDGHVPTAGRVPLYTYK